MQRKTLDLRYNELWNHWAAVDDELHDSTSDTNGKLLLSWRNLSVSVEQITYKYFKRPEITYKKILDNISGYVQCGTLLGIMGPSGSGKTTLLATISQRMKGNFDGELLFNGRPISEKTMMNISGFVPQHDIGFDQLTALEHLFLMARLKTDPRVNGADVRTRVQRTIAEFGLTEFSDTRISALSGGEQKKLALAVQLLDDPPLLFCDEITTGLDSYSAAHVVHTLWRVARTGKIVVCTIHQPASGVLAKFDQLTLLSDGRLVCQGPVPAVRRLFEKYNYECPYMFNEADFMISVLNSDVEKVKSDVDEMCKLSTMNSETAFDSEFFFNQNELDYLPHLQTKKQLWIIQFLLIFNRSLKCFLRSYDKKLLELGTILFIGVMTSIVIPHTTFNSQTVTNYQGFLFMFVINSIILIVYNVLPTFFVQFSRIHREIHNGVYSLSAYYVSELLIMVVWTLINMLLFGITTYTIVGFESSGMEYFAFSLMGLTALSYGVLFSAWFYKIEYAFLILSLYDFIGIPVSGSYLSLKSLPKPIYFLRFFSIYFLGTEVLTILLWEKIPHLPCNDVHNCLNSGKAVINSYGYISSNLYTDFMVMISFCILANIFSYFGFRTKIKKLPSY